MSLVETKRFIAMEQFLLRLPDQTGSSGGSGENEAQSFVLCKRYQCALQHVLKLSFTVAAVNLLVAIPVQFNKMHSSHCSVNKKNLHPPLLCCNILT